MLTDYCGATARLSPELGLALDPRRFAWSEKIDGVYARITTDRHGRIVRVMSRAARDLREASDLIGLLAGPPDAVLHGELEAHTEAGNRLAACRGYRNIHLFDATRAHGRSIADQPYQARYAELHKAHALIECAGAGRSSPWSLDDQGDAHDAAGRYTKAIPRDLRRFPIVPLHRGPGAAEALWRSHVEVGGGEGLVAVALDAPAGRRGAKRKIKLTDLLDALVTEVCSTAAALVWAGGVFYVSARGAVAPKVGEMWSVAHDGMHESGSTPRFARLVRRRDDLA